MKHDIVIFVFTALLFSALCSLAQDLNQGSTAEKAYVFDPITSDSIDQWQPIGRTKLRLRSHRLEAEITISKAGQMLHGIQRRGLGLPLPTAVRFWVYGERPYFWVILGDKAGHQVSSRVPLAGLETDQWCQAEVRLAEAFPLGVGAETIRDLDLVAILTQESGEVSRDPGPTRFLFHRFEALYPAGTGPSNPAQPARPVRPPLGRTQRRRGFRTAGSMAVQPPFEPTELGSMLHPLDPGIQRIERLLDRARAAGVETRYATVSLTVLKRYQTEVLEMLDYRPDPLVAKRTAKFLLECAARTERELSDAIAHPERVVRVPQVNLRNLKSREGSFFSGDRPVMLAGVCGWFTPDQFEQLAGLGYTVLSIEIGPSFTLPAENERRPEAVNPITDVLDAAAAHDMVCNLLLSPHYFPRWAREKWPSVDPTGWRLQTNHFLPGAVTDPHFRDVIAQHLAVTIPQVRNRPALLTYDLANEAEYRLIPDFPADQWAEFRHRNPQMDEWQALSAFAMQTFTDFVKWYVDEIHKHDPSHPIQMKIYHVRDVVNVDREATGDVLTANGMDAQTSYPDWTGRLAADFAWPLLRMDFHRSLTPDKPIMDDEYHISRGTSPMPAAYVRAALWTMALHGRDSTSCWVHNRPDSASISWHADGVEVLGHTVLDFLRLGPEIHAFQRQRAPLAIYYGGTGIAEAYLACLFQDVDVGVLTDRRIQQGRLRDYEVLVLPGGCAPQADTLRRIEAFKKAGGMVVECRSCVGAQQLWHPIRRAVLKALLPRQVAANEWGIECRSLDLRGRRLFYVINHRRQPVELRLQSSWSLGKAIEMRTGRAQDARRLDLGPLEIRLFEVK